MTRYFKYFFLVVISTIISTSVFAQRIESFYISATEIEEKKLSDDYIGIIHESLNLSKDCELFEKTLTVYWLMTSDILIKDTLSTIKASK